MWFSWRLALQYIGYVSLIMFLTVSVSLGEEEFDPDSIAHDPRAVPGFNPFGTLCNMSAWSMPVLDHNGEPHKDGHIIQIVADGGNGIQDPPNQDGGTGGDDSLADGNFNIQYINGEKHTTDGSAPGLFAGACYFISYKRNQTIYLRIWEGTNPATAEYYQDSEEFSTYMGNIGGSMIALRDEYRDEIDWKFGASKRVVRNR